VEVQVQLTSAWWKKTKKPFKGVPNTGLGKKFTAWETALAAVQKDKTGPKLDAANKALKELEATIKTAIAEFRKSKHKGKFDALDKEVSPLLASRAMKSARKALEDITSQIEVRDRVAKSANKVEAKYEVAWLAFEKLRKEERVGVALFEAMKTQLEKLEAIAVELVNSPDEKMQRKYQRQVRILRDIKRQVEKSESDYRASATICIMNRRDLLKRFKECQKGLTFALAEIERLKKRNMSSEQKAKKTRLLLASCEKQYKKVNDQYAPETTLRSAKDVKALKMAKADQGDWIRPESDKLFKANKQLIATIKKIRAAAE
jgi:hypothetical protein